ncbi:NAD-dependent succinate-semialdehyde dehydrogenase [Ilyomonas limi]|uniref:NAD-dependent succinate-semialdehyde dehydrogenase n=1 Tax=Ilyomonas limi TaxID=2575867 RepID=A0A4V5UVK8_9BACT|nr:NAD-dependent succinate-semialdehyde dehydrogenase [Ilyomonas limi]TKK65223.1 NAD-dependent succinate-semialdehyde dehydrogenase [Ilyomonas limi]
MQLTNTTLLQKDIFINNQWLPAEDNGTFAVYNPADGSKVADVANATVKETEQAIAAAVEVFKTWSSTPAKTRGAILKKWYELILDNANDLALLLTTEQGKPLSEAKGEVMYGASFVEWFAEEGRRTYGETIPSPVQDKRLITIKQPIGVVAAITPWNFPVAMITRKVAPAFAAGCAVVLKPAEDTPLCALALAKLAMDAGFPAGVFNVLPTMQAAEIGQVLTTHPAIAKVSFTGSTEVGRILMKQSASTVKKLSLELGGNAPVIVFDDAKVDVAVKGTIASKYRNAGQTCVCANRILVQENIYENFMNAYKKAVKNLQVGNGVHADVEIGPLINEAAVQKVETLMDDAISKGAEVVLGGKKSNAGDLFYEPTIITHCNANMRLSNAEIFGPVSAIYVFKTDEEAIALSNATEYGLAAYFFTENVSRAWRIAEQLQYGIVGINEGIISYTEAPFGGVKQSGYGREGSRYGIEEYMTIKYMCFGDIG